MSDFIGPCVHGRDPYYRCDDCTNLWPAEAEVLVLTAANVALSAALSDCMNSLQESDFCFKPGCGDVRCERATAAWNTGHACLAKYGAVVAEPPK